MVKSVENRFDDVYRQLDVQMRRMAQMQQLLDEHSVLLSRKRGEQS
jgi:hypothetical protein